MNEIVKNTGLSKGAFYHYFSSKEELFKEIVETYYLNFLVIDFEEFDYESFNGFYHDYIKLVVRRFMGLKALLNDTNDEDDLNYYILSFDAVNLFPDLKKQLEDYRALELLAWTEAIARGKASGELKKEITDLQVARMFIFSGEGIRLHLIQEGKVRQMEKEMKKLWNNYYEQIKA